MILIGAGGHSSVVRDVLYHNNIRVNAIYDDKYKQGDLHDKIPVVTQIPNHSKTKALVAIGSNSIRYRITKKFDKLTWITTIHPSSIIADDVEIGVGTVIMAGTILQPGVRIGNHCIINTGACLDHNTTIGDYSHIAPNCSIAGEVTIGDGTLVGIGSSIIPTTSIGKWVTVGAGSVVISDINDNSKVVGVPAKNL